MLIYISMTAKSHYCLLSFPQSRRFLNVILNLFQDLSLKKYKDKRKMLIYISMTAKSHYCYHSFSNHISSSMSSYLFQPCLCKDTAYYFYERYF
jgi:hypothetical protein